MDHLNATAACVLGLLLLGPVPGEGRDGGPDAMTGWQIYDTASRSLSRFWHVTRSQVYLELGRLEKAGLVHAAGSPGPRASQAYRVTPTGEESFRRWLGAWAADDPRDDLLRSPLLLTVFFGEFLPDQAMMRVLREYRPRYERQLEGYRRMQAALRAEQRGSLPAAVLRRGLAYREMMLRWIDELLGEMEDTQQ